MLSLACLINYWSWPEKHTYFRCTGIGLGVTRVLEACALTSSTAKQIVVSGSFTIRHWLAQDPPHCTLLEYEISSDLYNNSCSSWLPFQFSREMWHSFDAFRKRVAIASLTVAIDWSVNMNWFIIPVFASNCHLFFRFALLWFLPMPFNGPTMRVSLCVHQPNWFHFTWGFLPWKCCVSGYSCVRKYHIIHICRVHMLPSAWHIVSRIRCVFLLTYRKYLACARVCVCSMGWLSVPHPAAKQYDTFCREFMGNGC